MIRRLGFTLVSCCVLSAPIFAQTGGTISAGDVQFVRTPSSFDATPAADFIGLTSNLLRDHLYEHGWWFRVIGDSAETRLGVPDSEIYAGNVSTITWNDVAGRGLFSAEEYSAVWDPGSVGVGDGGYLMSSLTVTNLSPGPLTMNVFHLADIDLDGAPLDSAALVEYPFLIQVSDPGGNFAHYVPGPQNWNQTHYLVRPFGVTSVREMLNDGNLTDFDDTGLPFAAGDIGIGLQRRTFTTPPGYTSNVIFTLAVDSTLWCGEFYEGLGIFCDGLETADSRYWSAVAPFSD